MSTAVHAHLLPDLCQPAPWCAQLCTAHSRVLHALDSQLRAVEPGGGDYRFYCQTCPYVYAIHHKAGTVLAWSSSPELPATD